MEYNFCPAGHLRFTTTPGEIFKAGTWEPFCEAVGWDIFCVSEGLVQVDTKIVLSTELAEEFDLIRSKYRGSLPAWAL